MTFKSIRSENLPTSTGPGRPTDPHGSASPDFAGTLGALPQWVPIQWDDHGAGPAAKLAVTSSSMHDGETGSLQDFDHFFARQARCTRAHAAPTVTSNEVTTGWADWSGMGASSK